MTNPESRDETNPRKAWADKLDELNPLHQSIIDDQLRASDRKNFRAAQRTIKGIPPDYESDEKIL